MTSTTSAPSPVPARPTPSFPGLDSLRGIASIAVVATHVGFWTGYYDAGLIGAVAQRLEVGVAIFFVLSGFLLSYPWLRQLRTGARRDSTGRYFLKRALRILPVYWVTVVAAILLVKENADVPLGRWIDALLMIDLYANDTMLQALTQMWSLATEVAFYVMLPLIMAGLVRCVARGRWRPGALLVAIASLWVISVVWVILAAGPLVEWGPWVTQALPGYLGWFGIGIAFAVLDVDHRQREHGPALAAVRWCRTAASAPWTCWLLGVAVLLVASTPIGGPTELVSRTAMESVTRIVLYAVVAAALVIPSIFGEPTTMHARILALPALRHLGHISYSLFCCHLIVIAVAFERLDLRLFDENMLVVTLGVLAVSLLVSEVLYRVVELPFMRLKNVGRRAPTAAAAESPATASS
ncbi:acyltransferase family protein [Aeromicrobium wangtongii]|uniref:acyltransferase family protein n=1 Tax=Aeromicrobium wangtongii TaxID=2969247 RepID=UPI0020170A9C|nr:acyltransferase [Aeromicrobium wangtongii]MCL3818531.1 acyltransferase [Aeromicrobium wangtongii]